MTKSAGNIFFGLSLKRGFSGCGHGFSRCDGLDGLGGFDGFGGFGGFDGLGGFDGFDGFRGFDGFSGFGEFDRFGGFNGLPRLSLKGFSVSFNLLLKVYIFL